GLDSPPLNNKGSSNYTSSTLLRRQKPTKAQNSEYRCSLINIEETQDEELDAILGELSVLESQFNEEIKKPPSKTPLSPKKSSSEVVVPPSKKQVRDESSRTDSPDNDSAFCDNASVLSSSSSVRTDRSAKSASSSDPDSEEAKKEKEAKIKAEKIKLAIEKIKEASVKKLFIKVFTADSSAKSILVDEKMSVRHVTRILAEKNHVKLDPKWAIVELIPDLYMERVYEDHENVVENCLMWKMDSKNTLWFMERPEKFDVFSRPENYLLCSSSSQNGEQLDEHSRQELLEEYFSSSGISAPEVEGFIHLKAEGKKSWKKFYFVLRSSGLYYAPKGKKNSKDLVCLSTFDVNQVYYGTGWRKKYKAPSDYCFAIKNPTIQAKTPKYIRYLCVESLTELHRWVTGIRIAKNGHTLYENFRGIEEEMVHEDLDILTSKRFSGIKGGKYSEDVVLPIQQKQQLGGSRKEDAHTPSSENKSFDSALSSSGIASELDSPKDDEREPSINGHPGNGFDSDFPIGGTIKKRPNHPTRLHWEGDELIKSAGEEEEEEEEYGANNVRIGGGELLNDEPIMMNLPKTRKISFDERVTLIEPPPPLTQAPPNRIGSPPKAFLRDLQRVMTKKWQIAEKCREDREASPHTVLGFRDEISHLVGTSQRYSRDDSIGQWILQNTIYSETTPKSALKITEPLYAVVNNSSKPPSQDCVVLREPSPEIYAPPSSRSGRGSTEAAQDDEEIISNYSTIRFASRTGSFGKRSAGSAMPPPPPRRSENTHLTSH
ncbi:Putative LOC100643056, partial [Caligus rogercresseyi]